MPIVEHISQTVILKSVITRIYKGDLNQFKIDYNWSDKSDSEDAELLSFGFMGNHLDMPKEFIERVDFVHIHRYDGLTTYGDTAWLIKKNMYLYHKDSKSSKSFSRLLCDPSMQEVSNWIAKDGGKLNSIW